MRVESDVSFRQFRKEAETIRHLRATWSEKMKSQCSGKITEKQVVAINKEGKCVIVLEKLRTYGGSFTKPVFFMVVNYVTRLTGSMLVTLKIPYYILPAIGY